MANITHTLEELLDALQPLVGMPFRHVNSSEYVLTAADANKITFERSRSQGALSVDVAAPMKYIIERVNQMGEVSRAEIKKSSRIGNAYPITIKTLCEKSNLFLSIKNSADWKLIYRETYESLHEKKRPAGAIINEFYIQNYKNISRLHIQGLKRVNLFVGANNAGKSNLLEAVSLYASNFALERMMAILNERHENLEYFANGKSFLEEKDLLLAFAPFLPQRKIDFLINDNGIILGEDEENRISLKLQTAIYRSDRELRRLIRLQEYQSLTVNQQYANERETVIVSRPLSTTDKGVQTSDFANILQMIKIGHTGIGTSNTITRNRYKFQYVNCKRLTTDNIEDLWSTFSMTEMEETILEALRIVDERIEHFNFIKIDSNKYAPFVQMQVDDEYIKMPISEMGDGMTHILNMVVALIGCKDGILLLDEAESGLHYTIQMKLWRMIFELSEKFKVQVFATTHSNDCIDAFAFNNNKEKGNLIRLEKWGDDMHAQKYADMDQVISMRNNDMEIR